MLQFVSAARLSIHNIALLALQLAAACLGMGDKSQEYRPPITFVVVQKRHHTRLFPSRPQEGDRSGNILPGKPHYPYFGTCIAHVAEFHRINYVVSSGQPLL